MSYAIAALIRSDEGQGMAEYAIIFTLVVIVAAVAFSPLGTAISSSIQAVGGDL